MRGLLGGVISCPTVLEVSIWVKYV